MPYGIIFWGNSPHSSEIFKVQKNGQSKKWWDVDIGNLAENCLWNWKYCHSHHNIYSPY
jgi:hypothetical protein